MKGHIFILLIIFFGINHIFAQKISSQQKELEEKRLKLKKEIKQINNLLFSNSKTRKNASKLNGSTKNNTLKYNFNLVIKVQILI